MGAAAAGSGGRRPGRRRGAAGPGAEAGAGGVPARGAYPAAASPGGSAGEDGTGRDGTGAGLRLRLSARAGGVPAAALLPSARKWGFYHTPALALAHPFQSKFGEKTVGIGEFKWNGGSTAPVGRGAMAEGPGPAVAGRQPSEAGRWDGPPRAAAEIAPVIKDNARTSLFIPASAEPFPRTTGSGQRAITCLGAIGIAPSAHGLPCSSLLSWRVLVLGVC